MLSMVRLTPEQISVMWDAFKHGILIAMQQAPENSDLVLSHMLRDLMCEDAQCWLLSEVEEGEREVLGFGTTRIVRDTVTGVQSLNIITINAFRTLSSEMYYKAVNVLTHYARAGGCSGLTLQASGQRAKELAEHAGFKCVSENYLLEV